MTEIGPIELHRLWRETDLRLEALARSVDECRDLEPALDFCRYLLWSGMLALFTANPHAAPLVVDGPLLEYKTRELQREIQRRFATGDFQIRTNGVQLSIIHHKLDLIAGFIANLNE